MASQKYDAPSGPPPPAYGSDAQAPSGFQSPPQAHTAPSPGPQSDYYGASPYQQNAQPNYSQQGFPPQGQYQQGQYPQGPQGGYYGQQQQGGYYQQGPQMGYQQQGGYQPGYGPQGQYLDQRRSGGAGEGLLGGCLAALACCCCLDFLF